MRTILLVCMMLACPTIGCGNGSGGSQDGGADGGNSCADMTGSWEMTVSCPMSGSGASATMTQDGCELTLEYGDDGVMTGTVDQAGQVVLHGELEDGATTCTGTLDGDRLTAPCSPGGCTLELERR